MTFAGTWIASLTISSVLPALLASDSPASVVIRTGILRLALGIFFAGVFGVVLLRHAGMSQDARMFIAMVTWLVFGLLFPFAFSRRREAVAEITAEALPHRDPIERWLDQHGALLLRLAFVAIFIITPLVALARGPTAFWSGIASFALVLLVVAALGLARTPPPAPLAANAFAEPPSPGMRALRRAARFLTVVGFVLGLAYVWHIDLFEAANTHLGDTVARGIVTLIITVAVAYLVWDLIRMALAQSVLGPPRAAGERGEEGGGTAATRLQTFGPVLRNFLFVVVVTIATLVGLSSLGVNIGPLLAGAGVIGIALGFGAQTLVRDVISGVFFLAEDAFRIGEYVVIGNTRGTVEGIAIRSLKVRHHRGSLHTVPFGEIKQLTNESRDWIILKLEFLLAFDTDLRKVRKLVKEISKQLEADPELGHALLEPIKSQGVRRMEPTGMVIGLKIVAKPGSEVYLIRREVFQRVRDAFEQNGIHFARPQVLVASSRRRRCSVAGLSRPAGGGRRTEPRAGTQRKGGAGTSAWIFTRQGSTCATIASGGRSPRAPTLMGRRAISMRSTIIPSCMSAAHNRWVADARGEDHQSSASPLKSRPRSIPMSAVGRRTSPRRCRTSCPSRSTTNFNVCYRTEVVWNAQPFPMARRTAAGQGWF